MGNLYIVRHSITELNNDPNDKTQKEKLRGWLNVPLSEDGWKLAEKTEQHLRDKNIHTLFSSDLMRAKETSEVISSGIGVSIKLIPSLRPWNIGILEGTDAQKGTKIMKHYIDNYPTTPIKNGESYQTFYNRWKNFLEKILVITHKLPVSLCCVTHSRNIYCLEHILTKGKKPIVFDDMLNPGGILEINFSKNKIIKIL